MLGLGVCPRQKAITLKGLLLLHLFCRKFKLFPVKIDSYKKKVLIKKLEINLQKQIPKDMKRERYC